MKINISGNTFKGDAKVIGSINGRAVTDAQNEKLKEILKKADENPGDISLSEIIKEMDKFSE